MIKFKKYLILTILLTYGHMICAAYKAPTSNPVSLSLSSITHAHQAYTAQAPIQQPAIALNTVHNKGLRKFTAKESLKELKSLEMAFAAKDSKKELELLTKALYQPEMVMHAITLRKPKKSQACPEYCIRSYFESLPMVTEDDIELHDFLMAAAHKYRVPYEAARKKMFTPNRDPKRINKLTQLPEDVQLELVKYTSKESYENELLAKIYTAIYNGDTVKLQHLLALYPKLYANDTDFYDTCMTLGIKFNKPPCIKTLVNHGIPRLAHKLSKYVDIAERSNNKEFVDYFKDELIPYLYKLSADLVDFKTNILYALNHGADPNFSFVEEGWRFYYTPLEETLRKNQKIFTKKLLIYGANPNATTRNANNPLACLALEAKDPFLLKLLLDAKADPNAVDTRGNSLLHIARTNNDALCTQVLIDCKAQEIIGNKAKHPLAKQNYMEDDTVNSLTTAIVFDNYDSALKLLKNGFDPNTQDWMNYHSKNYPLIQAIQRQNLDIIRLLCRYGANTNRPCGENQLYPLEFAENLDCSIETKRAIATILKRYGARYPTLWERFKRGNYQKSPKPSLKEIERSDAVERLHESIRNKDLKKWHCYHDGELIINEYTRHGTALDCACRLPENTSEERVIKYHIIQELKKHNAQRATWLQAIKHDKWVWLFNGTAWTTIGYYLIKKYSSAPLMKERT